MEVNLALFRQNVNMPRSTLGAVETFSRVVIHAVTNEDADDGDRALVGTTFAVWTDLESPGDPLALYEIRGLVRPNDESLTWLPDDTVVDVVDEPAMAGRPEQLAADAPRIRVSDPDLSESWHPLIWDSEAVMGPVSDTVDPEYATYVLLCALSVVPNVPEVRSVLVAALAARLAQVRRDPRTYPPADYPWARID